VTEEDGDAPAVMQEAQVPIVSDATAKNAYPDSFEALTQLGAGFPQGGTDSCQGDSGGPLLVPAPDGSLRLVGDTSYGGGCARPNRPGIYGRLAGPELRGFLAEQAPVSIAPAPPTTATGEPARTEPAVVSQPASGSPAPATKSTRRTPCSKLHRGSARHNRTKQHKRQVKRCIAKRRAAPTPR